MSAIDCLLEDPRAALDDARLLPSPSSTAVESRFPRFWLGALAEVRGASNLGLTTRSINSHR